MKKPLKAAALLAAVSLVALITAMPALAYDWENITRRIGYLDVEYNGKIVFEGPAIGIRLEGGGSLIHSEYRSKGDESLITFYTEVGMYDCAAVDDGSVIYSDDNDPAIVNVSSPYEGQVVRLEYLSSETDYFDAKNVTLTNFFIDEMLLMDVAGCPDDAVYPAYLLDENNNLVGIVPYPGEASASWVTSASQLREAPGSAAVGSGESAPPTGGTGSDSGPAGGSSTGSGSTAGSGPTGSGRGSGTAGGNQDDSAGSSAPYYFIIIVVAAAAIISTLFLLRKRRALLQAPAGNAADGYGETGGLEDVCESEGPDGLDGIGGYGETGGLDDEYLTRPVPQDENVTMPVNPGQESAVYGLRCVDGQLNGRAYTFTGGELSIGRSPENTVRYPDDAKGVSRSHCKLFMFDGKLMLMDSGSSYGTFLDGKGRLIPHAPQPVSRGDSFCVGDSRNKFVIE